MSEITKAPDGIHEIEEIAKDTYRIDEGGIANTYLLIGQEKALLIDSGLGVGNILEAIKSLTDLPVVLALTHRHCDHAGGRNFFKECYCAQEDKKPIYGLLSSKLACKTLLKANKAKGVVLSKKPYHAKMVYFPTGQSFDLGGRIVKTILVPGHTEGSTVYLDEKTHLMFTGDDVNTYLWMQLPGCTTLSTWLVGARKIEELAKTYKAYGGHEKGYIPLESIVSSVALVEKLLKEKPVVKEKNLDYPADKTIFPRLLVAKKNLR